MLSSLFILTDYSRVQIDDMLSSLYTYYAVETQHNWSEVFRVPLTLLYLVKTLILS